MVILLPAWTAFQTLKRGAAKCAEGAAVKADAGNGHFHSHHARTLVTTISQGYIGPPEDVLGVNDPPGRPAKMDNA